MSECKHGLKHGCAYCQPRTTPLTASVAAATPKRRTRGSRLSEQMNDKMTALKKRLKEIRGE